MLSWLEIIYVEARPFKFASISSAKYKTNVYAAA